MFFSLSSLSVLGLAGTAIAFVGPHDQRNKHHAHQGIARANATLQKRDFHGTATWYEVGLGACGKYNTPDDKIVALNTAQYGSGYPGPNCFRSIIITAKGESHPATIMDECPTCGYGSLDLSESLFKEFAPLSDGVFQMSWRFTDGSDSDGKSNDDDDDDEPKKTTTTTHHTTSTTHRHTTTTTSTKKTTSTTSSKSSTTTSRTTTSAASTTSDVSSSSTASTATATTSGTSSSDDDDDTNSSDSTGGIAQQQQLVANLGLIASFGKNQ